MTNKQIEEKEIPFTYVALAHLAAHGLNVVSRLSEFIDNSIGSWDEAGRKRPLEITISIHQKGSPLHPGGSISIVDNAEGMNREELERAMDFGRVHVNKKYNAFGIGMKDAAFSLADDLYITTCKDGRTAFDAKIAISEKRALGEMNKRVMCEYSVHPYRVEKSGTVVTLRNLKFVSKIEKFAEYKKQLAAKYKRMQGVSITVAIYDEKGKGDSELLRASDKIYQTLDSSLVDLFCRKVKEIYAVVPPSVLKGIDKMAIEAAEKGLPLNFSFTPQVFSVTDINHEKPKTFPAEFGVIDDVSHNFKKFFGIWTYEYGRAINYSYDYEKGDAKMNNVLDFVIDYVRKNIKRAHGELDLSGVFEVYNDKNEFNFGDYRESFDDFRLSAGNDLDLLCGIVKEVLDTKKPAKRPKFASTPVMDIALLREAIPVDLSKPVSVSKTGTGGKIFVALDSNVVGAGLLETRLDSNYQGLELVVGLNPRHPLWSLMAKEEETKRMIRPLGTILGTEKFLRDSNHSRMNKSAQAFVEELKQSYENSL